MILTKDTVPTFQYGQTDVGLAAAKIIEGKVRFAKGVLLRSPGSNDPTPNTDIIWVGRANVTTSTGMPLAPGESLTLPVDNGDDLYAISTTASQRLAWLGG